MYIIFTFPLDPTSIQGKLTAVMREIAKVIIPRVLQSQSLLWLISLLSMKALSTQTSPSRATNLQINSENCYQGKIAKAGCKRLEENLCLPNVVFTACQMYCKPL